MKLHLDQLIGALASTLDLVTVDEKHHGKRVAYMTIACAEAMKSSQEEKTLLFRMGLLHDCGVSSTRVHKQLINELDWEGADLHCRVGEDRLRQFAPLAPMADAVRYHHTRWSILREMTLPKPTKRHANLIYLLDRIDALTTMERQPNRLLVKDKICDKINSLRHSYFDPELVDIFLAASDNDAFWITLEPTFLEDFLQTHSSFGQDEIAVDFDGLYAIASIFAQIVDAKSPYTAEHSHGVASLARFLAEQYGLPTSVCRQIEVAGLIHDLGKLQVPDMILDFEGSLSRDEMAAMHHHSYVTYQILSKIEGLENIALWASNHHERLDGSGYPHRRTAESLSIESRIIMIADIFQAMAQKRPYRISQPPEVIVQSLKKGVARNQLDAELVNLVETELDTCYAIATTPWAYRHQGEVSENWQ
jgi:HD-GYP domain-containing protein (c-di-GMP phosphodiesterase class II)